MSYPPSRISPTIRGTMAISSERSAIVTITTSAVAAAIPADGVEHAPADRVLHQLDPRIPRLQPRTAGTVSSSSKS